MTRGKLLALIGSICMGLVLAAMPFMGACSAPEPEPAPAPAPVEKPIELSLSHFFPGTHYVEVEQIPAWISDIEAATDGRVKITVYAAGTLLKGPETYDGVVRGVADIGMQPPQWSPGRFPAWTVFELPGLYLPNPEVAAKVTWEAFKSIDALTPPDSKMLYAFSTGPGAVYSKNPVRTLEDLKGMEVYATGATADIAKAWGAIPVGGDRSEVYLSLQKGIIDGDISGPPEVLLGYREAEVIDYITLLEGQAGIPGFYNKSFLVFMNLDKWNALPPDIQEAFDTVNSEWAGKAGKIWAAHMQEGLDFATECGVEFIEISPEELDRWMEPILPLRDQYVADMIAEGVPGQEIFDTVNSICNKYK